MAAPQGIGIAASLIWTMNKIYGPIPNSDRLFLPIPVSCNVKYLSHKHLTFTAWASSRQAALV